MELPDLANLTDVLDCIPPPTLLIAETPASPVEISFHTMAHIRRFPKIMLQSVLFSNKS